MVNRELINILNTKKIILDNNYCCKFTLKGYQGDNRYFVILSNNNYDRLAIFYNMGNQDLHFSVNPIYEGKGYISSFFKSKLSKVYFPEVKKASIQSKNKSKIRYLLNLGDIKVKRKALVIY